MFSPRLKILFVTGNAQKLADVKTYLGPYDIVVESALLDLPEVQAATVEEIAREKCRRAVEILQVPVLIEDTSLSFTAMNGMPGPYIKWFLQQFSSSHLHKMLAGFDDKSAQITNTFAYSPGPGYEPVILQGNLDGVMIPGKGPSSVKSFESAFEVEGKSLADMSSEERWVVSSRRRALEKLQSWLVENSTYHSEGISN